MKDKRFIVALLCWVLSITISFILCMSSINKVQHKIKQGQIEVKNEQL